MATCRFKPPFSSWDDLGFTKTTLLAIGFSARIMEMEPDIENMTLDEYREYEAEKESFTTQFFAQPPNTPNTPVDKKDSDFDEILDDLFRIGAKKLTRMGQEKVQNGCNFDTSKDTNHESDNLLKFPIFPTTNEFYSICEQDVDLEKEEAEVEDDYDGDTYDIWDIMVEDVERISQFLMPNVPDEMDEVIQPLIPQPIHTTPPNANYVAPATKSNLDELLEELDDEIMNVTMVDEEAAKDPQSYFTEIQKTFSKFRKNEWMLKRCGKLSNLDLVAMFQSLLSQLEIHGAGISTEDANQKFLRVFEPDVNGSTASSSCIRNVAFISSESTSSTNEVSTAYGVSTSFGHNSQREGSSSYTDELINGFEMVSGNDFHEIEEVLQEDREESAVEVSAVGGNRETAIKASAGCNWRSKRHYWNKVSKYNSGSNSSKNDDPQKALKNKGIVDSGCSRHMTGNKAYLVEYQDYNGGPVAFGGSKGQITGKDSECLMLSPDFKLPNENQVLLRVPRQNNMYSFNLENIVPTGGLACLIVKATVDESNKWHKRLGHNAGRYTHSKLRNKKFEEVQVMYEKEKKSIQDFVPIGSAEDERLIQKMNKKAAGEDTSKKENVLEEPDSTKMEVKQKEVEESTRKRPGTILKMKARKKARKQTHADSDASKKKKGSPRMKRMSKRKKIDFDLEEEEHLKTF
ncbi:hypothetical protein Tco_0705244 [Tanacetum coccineum]|uniref:Retrovirus-related Pol polyprotein from transposon TNT 1-94-like beta-barrel domain-containing protein n=1 Tax=Tanacetum coccineum TaxID=301880 RepID=A0ABQ4Y421_9ASTR